MVIAAWSKHLPLKILDAPSVVTLSKIGKAKSQLKNSNFEDAVYAYTD